MTLASASPSSIVSLRSVHGLPCAKSFTRNAEGKIAQHGYGNESLWDAGIYDASTLDALSATLTALAQRTDCICIAGRLLDDTNRTGIQRRLHGDGASIAHAERAWVAIDVDGFEVELTSQKPSPAEVIDAYWKRHLPPAMRSVSCWYQWTSGYGVGRPLNVVRARFWFVLDRPVHTEALRMWAKTQKKVDPAVFVACQPIYVASPIFAPSVKPPVPADQRFGVLLGATDVVPVDEMKLEPVERLAASTMYAAQTVRRSSVIPNEGEIDAALARIEKSATLGARHHHMLGAACELYALGAEPLVIAQACAELIRKQGREPNGNEIEDALKYAAKRDQEGALKVTKKPLSTVLGSDATDGMLDDDSATPASVDESDQDVPEAIDEDDDLEDALETMSDLRSENENAKCFLTNLRQTGQDLIRWAERDWFWDGMIWATAENHEALPARVMKMAEQHGAAMNAQKIKNITTSARMIQSREALTLPSWLTTNGQGSNAIVCQNGMVFVDDAILDPEGCLQPHNKDYFSTNLLPYNYDPKATCPTWEKCMLEWFPEDAESRREIQKMFGYLLVPDNQFEKFFVLTDKQGRAGKGTMVTVLGWLIGSGNICASSFSGLGQNFGLGNAIGKSVILLNEANASNDRDVPSLAIDRVKMITGNDQVEVEKKNLDVITTKLTARFVLSCNRPPKMRDASGALLKRMHLIEFRQTFFGRENSKLKDRPGPLYAELPGILNWAIEGLRMLYFEDKGFIRPASSEEYFTDMRRMAAPVSAFVTDCIQTGDVTELRCDRDAVYKAYRGWCREMAGIERPMTREAFFGEARQLLPHRIEHREEGSIRVEWLGVDFRELGRTLSGTTERMLGD
jgi:putative DNA primase/helicase